MPSFVAEKPSDVTETLWKALARIRKEFPDYEQDALGNWLLDLVENEERLWEAALNSPDGQRRLKSLVDKAMAEIEAGRTELLDFNKL
jgi:hypothetical protein